MYQAKTWISNAIIIMSSSLLCSMVWDERWLLAFDKRIQQSTSFLHRHGLLNIYIIEMHCSWKCNY